VGLPWTTGLGLGNVAAAISSKEPRSITFSELSKRVIT